MNMKKQLHIIVSGRVQGVFFRANAQKQARKLNLKGWCKNLPDRTVEILLEGEESQLEKFLVWCRKGPMFARVDNIETKWKRATGEFNLFSIRY